MKSQRSIYLVDDDEDDRMIMRGALEDIIDQVKIVEVGSGHDLIDLLDSEIEDQYPKLILMDMNMPQMNGLEAVSRVRAQTQRKHIPIIMLSTSSDRQLIKTAYQKGVNAYLTKPASVTDYISIAEAINVCFLNNNPSLSEKKSHVNSFRNKSILVIEDNYDHWNLISSMLQQSMPDADLTHVQDTQSTMEFLKSGWKTAKSPLKLIFLDLYLPTRQDGLNLLDVIRKFLNDNNLGTIPIIIFSGSDHADDIKICYRHQANIYIIKPINLQDSISHFQNLNLFLSGNYPMSGRN